MLTTRPQASTLDLCQHEHNTLTTYATSGPTTPYIRRRRHDRPAHHTPRHAQRCVLYTNYIHPVPHCAGRIFRPCLPASPTFLPSLFPAPRLNHEGIHRTELGKMRYLGELQFGRGLLLAPCWPATKPGKPPHGGIHHSWSTIRRSVDVPFVPVPLLAEIAARLPGGGKNRKDSVSCRLWLGGWMAAATFAGF